MADNQNLELNTAQKSKGKLQLGAVILVVGFLIYKYLKSFAPPDTVSLVRYRFGLVLFCLPIIAGILEPYLAHFIPFFRELPLWFYIGLDVIFIIGLFVLGGDFWDKLSGLFKYNVKAAK